MPTVSEHVGANAKAYTAFAGTFTVQALYDELYKIMVWMLNGFLGTVGVPADLVASFDKIAGWGLLGLLSLAVAWIVKMIPNIMPPESKP